MPELNSLADAVALPTPPVNLPRRRGRPPKVAVAGPAEAPAPLEDPPSEGIVPPETFVYGVFLALLQTGVMQIGDPEIWQMIEGNIPVAYEAYVRSVEKIRAGL